FAPLASGLPRLQEPRCEARDVHEALRLLAQAVAADARQSVGLLVARSVERIEALDPSVFEHPGQRAVECSGRQAHPPLTERLDRFHQGVAVLRLVGEAEQDPEDGLTEWRHVVWRHVVLERMACQGKTCGYTKPPAV